MRTFEYGTLNITVHKEIRPMLCKWGREGWRVVSTLQAPEGFRHSFLIERETTPAIEVTQTIVSGRPPLVDLVAKPQVEFRPLNAMHDRRKPPPHLADQLHRTTSNMRERLVPAGRGYDEEDAPGNNEGA
jgi:hypothetical protein